MNPPASQAAGRFLRFLQLLGTMPIRAEDLCVISRRRGGRLRSASPTVSTPPSTTSSGRRCCLGRPWRLRRPQDRHPLTTAMRRYAVGSRTLPSAAAAERTHPARSPQPVSCPRPSTGQDAPAGPTALCRGSRRRPGISPGLSVSAEPGSGVTMSLRMSLKAHEAAIRFPLRCLVSPGPAQLIEDHPCRPDPEGDHDHTSEPIQAARALAIQRYRLGRALCRDVVAAGMAADR